MAAHKHAKLIEKWTNDQSTRFEFAHGTGVDFIWASCDINFVINNPHTQVRVKNKIARKEKRWVAACNSGHNCIDKLFDKKNQAEEFVNAFYPNNRVGDFQFIEIEIEVEV